MRIREGNYGYDLEQPVDPHTQLRSKKWKFAVYQLQPIEEVLTTGEAPSREEAEKQARQQIARLSAKPGRRPAA